MKDPFDNRPDAYALLKCPETCTRAKAQRSYTAQLLRRTASQRDLQAARELLVHSTDGLCTTYSGTTYSRSRCLPTYRSNSIAEEL